VPGAHRLAAEQAVDDTRHAENIASDAWLGTGALMGAIGGYFLYESYVTDQPTVQVAAAPEPGGGAFSLSGTF
jgi:hypothetical protein